MGNSTQCALIILQYSFVSTDFTVPPCQVAMQVFWITEPESYRFPCYGCLGWSQGPYFFYAFVPEFSWNCQFVTCDVDAVQDIEKKDLHLKTVMWFFFQAALEKEPTDERACMFSIQQKWFLFLKWKHL